MENKKNIELIASLSLLLILIIRIAFFLRDGSSDLVESILIWVIYIGSLAFTAYLLYKVYNKTENLFIQYKDKIYLAGFVILMEVGFSLENSLQFNTIHIYSVILMLMCLIIFSMLLPKKASKVFDIVFMLIFTIYVFAQDFYYRLFNDFFSFKEYGNAAEGAEFAEGTYEFSFIHVYFVFMLILFLTLYLIHNHTSHIKFSKKTFKSIYAVPLFMFFLVNINAALPVNAARLHMSDHYLYYSIFSKERFVEKFGTLNLLVRDSAALLTPSLTTRRDLEYIEDYYENNIKIHSENDYTNIFEGKNLVFIVGESFDSIVVSEELTPNIYKLKTEGLDFQNHFTPVFPRTTCDTEVIFTTSIIPSIQDGPTCYVYNENTFSYSLPELFNNVNYATNAFHNNYKEFYTRHIIYDGFGYDSFYGQNELGLSETDIRYDSIFMEESLDYSVLKDEQFFSFMLTLSGHSPYELTNLAVDKHFDSVDDYYRDSAPQAIKKYIASQIEVDEMVGILLADLEDKGILDDTVIILTNDHYPYALDQDAYESYKNIDENYMKSKAPLFIWSSDIEHEVITKLTSSFDILPTIVNMFGLEAKYDYYVGNDIFSNDYEPIVYFKDYSIYDGIHHYALSSSSEESNLTLIQSASKYYELSRKLLKIDYFK